MGDDIISNAQPVKLLDEQDNPFGVQSNPLVVQFNGSVGVVQVTGTVPVSFTQPVEVAVTGTQNVVLRDQPVQVTGTVVATGVSVSVGTVAVSTNPLPVSGTVVATGVSVTVGSHAVGVVGPVTVNGTVAVSTNPVPVSFTQPVQVTVSGTQNVAIREQPIQVAGTVTAVIGGNGTISLGGQPILVTTVQNQGRFHGWTSQTAVGIYPIRPATYTPQAAGAQRSVNSTNANDTAAGTGARTIRITYYTQTGTGTLAGPFYEIVTLNGTTGVNTVATDIRYISELEVLTAGTGGVNAGAIQIWTGTGATGTVWASIPIGNYDMGSAHFYVCSNCVFDIADVAFSTTAASANSPGFIVRYRALNDANAAERLLIPDIRGHIYTPQTHSFQAQARVYGPALVTVYYRCVNATTQIGAVDVGYSESLQ